MSSLNTGVFIDLENLRYCGGHALDFEFLSHLLSSHNLRMTRGNIYAAYDQAVLDTNEVYNFKFHAFWDHMSLIGFSPKLKQVKRFSSGEMKANSDIELAVDALISANSFEAIVIASGDGDFIPLVQALKAMGKKVFVLGLANVCLELIEAADIFIPGFLYKELTPATEEPFIDLDRGVITRFNSAKKFGFIRAVNGYGLGDFEYIYFNESHLLTGYNTLEWIEWAIRKKTVCTFERRSRVVKDIGKSFYAVNISEFAPEKRSGGTDERFRSMPMKARFGD